MEERRKDEFEMKAELEAKRKEIKTMDELVDFLKYVEENCNYDYGVAPLSIAHTALATTWYMDNHDYGVAPRSIAQTALATTWYMANKMGITGFQAGFIMWDFIRGWRYQSNECGLKIVDYDDMLYPQYDYKFEKTIENSTWIALQEQAKKNLEDSDYVHPDVIAHWESIIRGEVPFGYKVKED